VRPALALSLLLLAACEKVDPAAPPAGGSALKTWTPPSGGEMVLAPAGESLEAFYVDRTAVTQELYQKVMGSNPSKRKDPKRPVEPVRWTEAVRFLNRCSEMDGLSPCYDLSTGACDFAADGYRLPTEAEWEYACLAGSRGKYSFGDDPGQLGLYAWYKTNSGGQTHPVAQKKPNAWGLHDMHGNVWQWCNDWYADERGGNPRGPESGKQRVLKGGAWESPAERCAVAFRAKDFPAFTDACFGADSYGFRRVKSAKLPSGPPRPVAAAAPPPPPPVSPPPLPPPAPPAQADGKDRSGLKGTIVFVSNRSGALDIWRMHASGKDQKPLTKDDHPDADPKFSPDGKRILHTSMRGGVPEVWVMGRDGSEPRKVTQGAQPGWSPDGASIVFIRDGQAWVRELASGKERRVSPERWDRCGVPAWSPDGKRIAMASRHEESVGIWLVGLEGEDASKLKTEDPSCTPAWSADGKRLLCQTTKGRICQLEADGKNWEEVTFGADVQHDARYSPDGKAFVFCRAHAPEGPWQVHVQRLDADASMALTSEGSNQLPDWHALED
jgi:WD40 repeat protein